MDDRIRAYQQIASNLSTLQLNGWDTAQKCLAACWLAHGSGMHPAVFMQNNYSMILKGRLVIEPKWQFLVAMLQSRVPGFVFKVLDEGEKSATVEMSDGRNTHKVTYTLEDARRQGLLGRENAWTSGNTREMCLGKAIKRCAWRFPGALMDLPLGDYDETEMEQTNGQPSPTQAIDEAIEGATKPQVEDATFQEIPAESPTTSQIRKDVDEIANLGPELVSGSAPAKPEAPKQSPRQRLYATLVRWYGGALNKDLVAEKASFIYNEMMKERTGNDPKVTFQPGQIGPVEAEQLIEYLEKRIATKGLNGAKAQAPAQDDAPPAEEATEPERASEQGPEYRTAATAYEEFHVTIARAKKLFGRKYLVENPPGSGKWWFTDQPTFSQAGEASVLLLVKDGAPVVPMEKIDQLNRILAAACDERERGGR